MDISYKTSKLKKICTDASFAQKNYGIEMAEKIQLRIDQISAADSVEFMIQYKIGRCHPLHHNREGQYALDLVQPYRLVFEKNGNKTKIVKILEIVNYHN